MHTERDATECMRDKEWERGISWAPAIATAGPCDSSARCLLIIFLYFVIICYVAARDRWKVTAGLMRWRHKRHHTHGVKLLRGRAGMSPLGSRKQDLKTEKNAIQV